MFSPHTDDGYHEPLPGIAQKTRVFGAHTLMAEFRLTKGSALPLHAHPYEQTGYLVKGHLRLRIGHDAFDVQAGDAWSIPMHAEHGAEVMADSVALEVFHPARQDYLPKVLPLPGEGFTVHGCTAFLILPVGVAAGAAIPWVWYAPTLPGLPGPEEKWMFEKFVGAGIAVAGIDVGESYGSPRGRELFCRFHEHLVAQRGLSPKPCLLGRSRGGLMLYNWAVENPQAVAGVAGIYPVCDLRSYPGLAKACIAYGLAEAELQASLTAHNPVDRLAPLARAGVPLLHIHGDSDTVVPLEANSGALAERYRQLGGEMTLQVVKGGGHDMWQGWFQCQDLVDFVIRHCRLFSPGR